jgi:hypothetical protein
MKSRYQRLLLILGIAMVGLAALMGNIDDPAHHIPVFLFYFTVFFIVYCAAVFVLARLETSSRWTVGLIFGVSLLCRLALLAAPPSLSTDIYRYLWEGRVTAAGHNPFALPPSAPELESFRDENFDGVSHKHMETIYPPLAQGVFALGAAIRPDLITLKIIFVLFDLATMVVLFRLLILRRRQAVMCASYGWSPLVILEFAHSGHVDSVGIFFLVLAVYLFEKRRTVVSTSALALSFLAKFFAMLLVPFFLFKKRYAVGLIPFVLIAVVGFLPFADAGGKLVSSLSVYGRHWEFNSALFSMVRKITGHPDWVRVGFVATALFFSIYQGYRRSDFLKYAYRVVAVALLLTPTFYPWYLCWLIPFLCFFPRRSWIYLSGAVILSYWVWVRFENTGVWDPGPVVMAVEWVPFFGLLALEAIQSRRRRGEDMT